MDEEQRSAYPLPVTRALQAAGAACAEAENQTCHSAVLRLAGYLTYYLGAVAVAQYSQALYTGEIEADPTLNRSLRTLRRALAGQWLGWLGRSLDAYPDGPVHGLASWYSDGHKEIAIACEALRRLMVDHLSYPDERGPVQSASPRELLEMVDRYRVRRGKTATEALPLDFEARVAGALLHGLHAALAGATFLREYRLYAPRQRQLLMGAKATTPMPPLTAPADAEASLLLYPPGEAPDYTKRPTLEAEQAPLFPLDPLLVYLHCPHCGRYRPAALREMVSGSSSYLGLDPDCEHTLKPSIAGE